MQVDGREYFNPTVGAVYADRHGLRYRCMRVTGASEAIFENVRSGWTFKVHGTGIYKDGTIDWYISTDGHFNENRR